MDFYDIHEQNKYSITVSKPEKVEELSDAFITQEELETLTGGSFWPHHTSNARTYLLNAVIEADVQELANKLDASGKKTLLIEDEDLLEVLKNNIPLAMFTPSTNEYARRGNRICYARKYKRKKKRATQGDVRAMWNMFTYAFHDKYGAWPPYTPGHQRSCALFKAFKDIVGWKRMRKHARDKENVKFYRQIWDNPEEYIS